jgi:hypothetical protein
MDIVVGHIDGRRVERKLIPSVRKHSDIPINGECDEH